MDWDDAVAQVQPALKLLLVADGKHWVRTTEGGKVTGGLTVGDDTCYAQLLGSLDGCVSQEEFLVYLAILHWVDVVQWRLILLCLLGNAGHGLHCFHWILTTCRFA